MFGAKDGEVEKIRVERKLKQRGAMFGVASSDIRRMQHKRWFRWWVVLLQLLGFALGLVVIVLMELLLHPEHLDDTFDKAFPRGNMVLRFEAFEIMPLGDWKSPSSWRISAVGMTATPTDPKKPDVRIQRIVAALPNPLEAAASGIIRFPWARISELKVTAHQQRPPPSFEVRKGIKLYVERGELWNAGFSAPPDYPLGAVEVGAVDGLLDNVLWDPGARTFFGSGIAEVGLFHTGSLSFDNVHVTDLKAFGDELQLEGRFKLGASPGSMTGTIANLTKRPKVDFDVILKDLPLTKAVQLATGSTSPLLGTLDLELLLHSGGNLPRGGAKMEGKLKLRHARMKLPKGTKPIVYDVIRIAPFVGLNRRGEMTLGNMDGEIRFGRGEVKVQELNYHNGAQRLRMWGEMAGGNVGLTLRVVPKEDADERPGFGIVMYGTTDAPRFRLAKPQELLPSAFGPDGRRLRRK